MYQKRLIFLMTDAKAHQPIVVDLNESVAEVQGASDATGELLTAFLDNQSVDSTEAVFMFDTVEV